MVAYCVISPLRKIVSPFLSPNPEPITDTLLPLDGTFEVVTDESTGVSKRDTGNDEDPEIGFV